MTRTLDHQPLLADIQQLINKSRQKIALAVNAELTMLYWRIGHRINVEILKDTRATLSNNNHPIKLIISRNPLKTLTISRGDVGL
ncbi:TPA: DUF1016 family protein [Legionella pneumophila subsp. pneumophila]|nr:DUF1016 family protein [Legionella pneumophila subsp. pneumophila]